MGNSVSKWNPEGLPYAEACKRAKQEVKDYAEAYAAHPLASVLEGLSDESNVESEKPRWRGTEKVFSNGTRRLVIRKVHPKPQAALDNAIRRDLGMPTGQEVDPDPEENRKRAARRAKTTVIDKAIQCGMNSLHTLTFRANVTDLDEALRCFDLYRRKCQKLLPGWRYVVCWQRQKRGAWHFHLATYRLPRHFTQGGAKVKSWDLMRRLWREAAGVHGGNFDEVREKRRYGSKMPIKGAARIARYIGRYIGRDIGTDEAELLKGRKSFATSKGIDVPRPLRYTWDGEALWGELLEWAFRHVGGDSGGRYYWFSPELDLFFIECDPTAPYTVEALDLGG